MEVTALSIKIILLLVPGAIASLINDKLSLRPRAFSPFNFVVYSILFGLLAYAIFQLSSNLIYGIINKFSVTKVEYYQVTALQLDSLENMRKISGVEILIATFIAIILAFIVTGIGHNKLIYRFAQKFGISNKYGDENLFLRFSNSPDVEWIYVRCPDKGLTYSGALEFYAETGDINEIVLSQVTVYDYSDSTELYNLDKIYLSLSKNQTILEQAIFETNGKQESEEKTVT